MLHGYARVSVREPEDKNLDLQVERRFAPAALGQHSSRGIPRGQECLGDSSKVTEGTLEGGWYYCQEQRDSRLIPPRSCATNGLGSVLANN